jgi:hypothetical protein
MDIHVQMLKAKKNWLRKYKKSSFHLNDWVIFSCLFNNVNKIWMLCIRTYMREREKYESLWTMSDAKKLQFFDLQVHTKGKFLFPSHNYFIFTLFFSPSFPFEWSVKESIFYIIIIIIICANLMDKSVWKNTEMRNLSELVIHHSNINIINLHSKWHVHR